MGQHNFETVQTFSFVGSVINDNNANSEEILTRIKKGSKAFFIISSNLIGKQPKMTIYISTINPFVTYVAETWTWMEGNVNY
jgi:hypothetical protein